MSASSSRLLLAAILLLASIAPAWATYTETTTSSLRYARGDPNWEIFRSDARFSAVFRLFVDPNTGPVILTPGVDTNDLPDNLLICPGMLNVSIEPSGIWLVNPSSTQEINCSYDHVPDPVDSWALASSNIPITWNPNQIINCADLQQTRAEPIGCPTTYIYNTALGQPEWTANPAPAQVNVNYKRWSGGIVYQNKKAMVGLMCNGTLSFGASSAYAASGTAVFFGQMVGATTMLLPAFTTDRCKPNVEAMPSNQDPQNNVKYFYFNNQVSQLPAVVRHGFNVTVADPISCTAEFVSVNPTRLEDLADPLLPNSSYGIQVIVRNPNPDIYIQATGVDVIPPSNWSAAMGSDMPNGFFQDIAPNANQLLRINLTTPNESIRGPVRLTIYFNSSTLMCNRAVCNSTLNLTLFNTTTFDDLAAVWVAPASVPLSKPPAPPTTFTVEAVTYNRGNAPVPSTTNTSVILDGAPARYYLVPNGLQPASDPVPPDPYPRPVYVSRTYQMTCAFAHPIVVVANADWNNQLNEIDENNNRAVAIIQCGRSLLCPDYT